MRAVSVARHAGSRLPVTGSSRIRGRGSSLAFRAPGASGFPAGTPDATREARASACGPASDLPVREQHTARGMRLGVSLVAHTELGPAHPGAAARGPRGGRAEAGRAPDGDP